MLFTLSKTFAGSVQPCASVALPAVIFKGRLSNESSISGLCSANLTTGRGQSLWLPAPSVAAAGKTTACHTCPKEMQAVGTEMSRVWRRMVSLNFHLCHHWVQHLQKRLLKKYHISPLHLRKQTCKPNKHLQQDLNHAKHMPEWVAPELLQHSPLSN